MIVYIFYIFRYNLDINNPYAKFNLLITSMINYEYDRKLKILKR